MLNTIDLYSPSAMFDLLEKNKLNFKYHNDTIVIPLYTISSLALLYSKRKGKMELLLPHGLNNSSYAC